MSRSYKHTPIAKLKNDKKMKSYAVKTLRHHTNDIANGSAYKRLFCSWNICDYKCITSVKEFYSSAMKRLRQQYPSKSVTELSKIAYDEYRRFYIQK